MKLFATAFALVMLSVTPSFALCTTDTPVSLFGNDGVGNGLLSNQGGSLAAPPSDLFGPSNILNNGSVVGQVAGPGVDGGGVAHLNGTADCGDIAGAIDDAANESAALAAALSNPTYLRENEKFSISGGIGFAEDSVAGGATLMLRLDSNVAAYVGGAVSENLAAGKGGIRVGW
ncbi:MAG: hypothetical protein AB7Q00_14415 [Phycisphaerales bacterium]